MDRIAVFPGSFDPLTIGHEDIVRRALPLFDRIIVAIGYNTTKGGVFPLEKRIEWINKVFRDEERIEVDYFEGLTIEYCRKRKAKFLLRGLRTAVDFEYERAIGQSNKTIAPDIESVFLLTSAKFTHVNSTIVRDIHRHGGDVRNFLPEEIDLTKYKL